MAKRFNGWSSKAIADKRRNRGSAGLNKPKKGGPVNSKKITIDGIKFDSKLEGYQYQCFKDAGIVALTQHPKITLMEGYKVYGRAIRAITYTPDFFLPDYNIVVENKGRWLQPSVLRVKLAMNIWRNLSEPLHVIFPRTQKNCLEVATLLKTGHIDVVLEKYLKNAKFS